MTVGDGRVHGNSATRTWERRHKIDVCDECREAHRLARDAAQRAAGVPVKSIAAVDVVLPHVRSLLAAGLTVRQVADTAGVDYSYLTKLLAGQRGHVSERVQNALLRVKAGAL